MQEIQNGAPSANLLTGLGVDEYLQRTDASGPSSYLTDALASTLGVGKFCRRTRDQLHVRSVRRYGGRGVELESVSIYRP